MNKLLCVVLSAAALTAVGQNLLENPSFEIQREQNSALPEAWDVYKTGCFEKTHRLEEQIFLNGKRAARIDNLKKDTKDASLIWMQKSLGAKLKSVQPGTEMELSVMATAVDAPVKARIYLESMKAKKCFIVAKDVLPGQWTKVSVRFKTEDIDYGQPYVCLQLLGNGSAIFDCAYLGPAGKNPWDAMVQNANLVGNGGAEVLDEKGVPAGWYILKGQNGQATVTTENAASGRRAFQLKCENQPQGMLAWGYLFAAEDFAAIAPGTEVTVSMKAHCGNNPGTRFRFYVEFKKGSAFIGTFMAADQSVYVGWQEKKLTFKMPKDRPTTANIYIQLMTPGVFTFDDVSVQVTKPADPQAAINRFPTDYCRIAAPAGYSNFFQSVPKEFLLEFFLPGQELTAELFEIDGNKITEWKFRDLPAKKKSQLKLTMPDNLPENSYELRFTSGKMVDYEWFRIGKKKDIGAHFDDDGILVLDGKRFFPIGVVTPVTELDGIRVYSESGINTVSASLNSSVRLTEYQLAAFQYYHMNCFGWSNWGMLPYSDAQIKKQLEDWSGVFRKYRGIIGLMTDEAPWNGWKLENIRQNYKLMYKYLPDYVFWLNNAPRLTGAPDEPRQAFESVRAYSRAADLTGLDIYPVPEGPGHNNLSNETISCVGEYTDLCRNMIWDRKPVWMILQAMGWSEENGKLNDIQPRPTEKQLRFMVWNAITHGAKGIFWYGAGAKDVYSEWYRGFARVNLELQELAPLLMAGPMEKISGLPKNVSGIKGKGYQVIVNENKSESVTVAGKTIAPQDVLFLTDQPMKTKTPARFTEKPVTWQHDFGITRKTVLLDGEWVAHPEYLRGEQKTVYAKQTFTLKSRPEKATFRIAVDDQAVIYLNGTRIGNGMSHSVVCQFNVAKYLTAGENEIRLDVTNVSGPTGLDFEIEIPEGKILSGANTLFSLTGKGDWKPAYSFGKMPVSPWGKPDTLMEEK